MTHDTQPRSRRDGVALWRRIADVLREEIERGIHREGRALSSGTEPAPAEVARDLGLGAEEPVVVLETLSLVDGQPLSLATHWFPLPRFVALPAHFEKSGSITRALLACGVADYTRRETRITARSATPEEASILLLPVGAPLLISEAVNIDPDGTPTHVSRARFAAERVQMVVRDEA